MSHFNSQEQTIYRRLAGQIQLEFYCDGQRFPSAKEIASRYQVSYCPAQRALKALENDGLIKLCRGKETVVLAKPYEDFLKSPVFQSRVVALADLIQALKLISSSISFQGLYHMKNRVAWERSQQDQGNHTKRMYRLFDESLQTLGSRTIQHLYYDIGAFAESAFQDILYAMYGKEETVPYLNEMTESVLQSLLDCQEHRHQLGKSRLERLEKEFFEKLEPYFSQLDAKYGETKQEPFIWEPYKGRTRYCDIIAIDILRKIDQGDYPVGSRLPNGAILADIYHVSEITIRRTIGLLNKMEVTRTQNGVGTSVVCKGDSSIPYKIKNLTSDDNFKAFLESLQLLAITCEPVIQYTFPHCSAESLDAVRQAAEKSRPHSSMVATIGACLQSIVHHCPLAAIQEIYGKITLLLLNGSILQFRESGRESISNWTELSHTLSESLDAGDGHRFASIFREIVECTFAVTKKNLLEIGVASADVVKDPVPSLIYR